MNKQMLSSKNDVQYFTDLCKQLPLLIIKTQCGLGKYQFKSIGIDESKLMRQKSFLNQLLQRVLLIYFSPAL